MFSCHDFANAMITAPMSPSPIAATSNMPGILKSNTISNVSRKKFCVYVIASTKPPFPYLIAKF